MLGLRRLVIEDRPWYEALGLTAERATDIMGEGGVVYVQHTASGLTRHVAEIVISASDVDALKPVCVCFKALFDAVKGATQNRNDLVGLIDYGVLIVKSMPEAGTVRILSPAVKELLTAFGEEVELVIQLARSFVGDPKPIKLWKRISRRFKQVGHHTDTKEAIKDHALKFDRILSVLTAAVVVHSVETAHAGIARLEDILQPPPLPKLAAIPSAAISLSGTHVSRPNLLGRAIGTLTDLALAKAPCVLAGMGGAGKTVLASAVVRNDKVREHFRAGVFWLGVGRGAKDKLHALLQDLVRQLASRQAVVAPELETLEDVTRHLTAEVADGRGPRLVVLDDVWEREVVNALLYTGLQLLVTTRDRSVVSMPGGLVEVGDMDDDEALQVLRRGCGASPTLELPRAEALQVNVCVSLKFACVHVMIRVAALSTTRLSVYLKNRKSCQVCMWTLWYSIHGHSWCSWTPRVLPVLRVFMRMLPICRRRLKLACDTQRSLRFRLSVIVASWRFPLASPRRC